MASKSSKSRKVTVIGPKEVRALFHNGTLDPAKVTIVKTVKGEKVEQPADASCLFGGPQGRGRGRVAKPFREAAIAHLAEQGIRAQFAEKVTNVKTVTLPVTKTSKSGATLQRPVDVPLAEFRRLSGQKMGRPSAASLAKAAEAYTAEQS